MPAYTAFGLRIDSEIELEGVVRGAPSPPCGDAAKAVVIRWGAPGDPASFAPVESEGWYEFSGDVHRFGWAELGVVAVRGAREITVWPIRGVARGLVEHVLLGPIFADILLSRGYLPLHASACQVDGGVVAFVGRSGQGKSTLVAAMHANGFEAHGDDLIAVPCGEDPLVCAGIARIKLNQDTAIAVGESPSELPTIYAGVDKRSKPISYRDPLARKPLVAIYRLLDDSRIGIVPTDPKAAVFELLPNCFRVEVEQYACGFPELFRRCAAVLERVPMFELRRPQNFSRLSEVVSEVAKHARTL